MASHTARVIDLADYRRRRQGGEQPVAPPVPMPPTAPMVMVWVPMLTTLPMMPFWR
ncbi:hypothetical protein [Siculibacillus lacustris]|uniref:hypothetical protein n=1 Tax=Siculibacillus lacustris TaxID=1549641 RepID=UPI001D17E447|nr:hypothetical protein [Siculibacillus lacustris]